MRDYLYNLATDRKKGKTTGVIKGFLFSLSLIYGLAVRLLIFVQGLRRISLPCKIISVGNITLGGTGKTVLVEFIARYLKQQGHKVAILTRGYKRKITDYALTCSGRQGLRITDGSTTLTMALKRSRSADYENMGDEPYMLQMALKDVPVVVDKNRLRAARRAIRDYGVDTVILDDGLQQWRLKKDLEIVTIDASNPFGNRYLLPRGILRQPLSSLKEVDMFVITKTNLCTDTNKILEYLYRLNPLGIVVESAHKPVGFYNIAKPTQLLSLDFLKGKTVTLFSGIGDPASFENLISSLGIKIGLSFNFTDHHNYANEDLYKIIKDSRERDIDTALTTQKDAVRIFHLLNTHQSFLFLVLRIELKITKNEKGFYNRLRSLYNR